MSLLSVDLAEPVPDGWDSAAFCSNFLKASDGDMAEAYFPGSRVLILRIKRNYEKKRLEGGLQKAFYNALLSTIPPAFAMCSPEGSKFLRFLVPTLNPSQSLASSILLSNCNLCIASSHIMGCL